MLFRIFLESASLLELLIDSYPSLKAAILPVNAVELPASLGIFAEGSSLSICSKNGFNGPLAVPLPNSSTLSFEPAF
jgi:hypothetical protein